MSVFLDHDDGDGGAGGHDSAKTNWSSIIGIVSAIIGNALIALALNVQRYAHIRVHKRRAGIRARARQALKNSAQGRAQHGGGPYGAAGATHDRPSGNVPRRKMPVDAALAETQPLTPNFDPDSSDDSSDGDTEPEAAITYLKDPYWWFGQILISVGEMGNFLAYGFAPASIVSPLGVVALISNCIVAPLFFREVFRPRDFWGVIIAIGGAVTVVLSAKQEETKLGPHDVWDAITTMEFVTYMGVSCALIVLLMCLSPRYGNRTILIDLGLVGLFGGYTALSTKGVSSMLSSTLLGAFTTPVTYVLFFVLLSTAVLQVRYVNKALQRFDSTQVIPIQFVLFTLSVIIGSAVLYRDFERTSAEQAAKFVGGCLLTFFGVFLITSGRPPTDHDEEALSDDDDIDETIRLAEQEPSAPQAAAPRPPSRRASDAARPRRSRTSRVSFKESLRPGSFIADSGIPSHRSPSHASNLRLSLSNEDLVDSPLLTNPWREGLPYASRPQHPNVEHAIHSSDSVPLAAPISASDMLSPSTPQAQLPQTKTRDLPDPHNTNSHLIAIERPMTPRPSASGGGGSGGSRPHSHHCGGALISPSPFSSTVSAVVADKLLAHMDSPTLRRVLSRRSRRSLRNSLYVPADELYADGEYSDLENQLESAIEPGYGRESGHEADQLLPSGQTSIRTRARSLSHTLGDLFSGKKKMSLSSLDEDEQGKVAGREVPSTAEASESRDAL